MRLTSDEQELACKLLGMKGMRTLEAPCDTATFMFDAAGRDEESGLTVLITCNIVQGTRGRRNNVGFACAVAGAEVRAFAPELARAVEDYRRERGLADGARVRVDAATLLLDPSNPGTGIVRYDTDVLGATA